MKLKRGDILSLQTIILIPVFVLIIVLLFSLFWVQAQRFHQSLADSTATVQSEKAFFGGVALRSYLATRLDAPIEKFLPTKELSGTSGTSGNSGNSGELGEGGAEESGTSSPIPGLNPPGSSPLTMGEAIERLQKDEECIKAIKKSEPTYLNPSPRGHLRDESGSENFKELFQTNMPGGLCRTFFLRTILYWSVIAPNETFVLDTGFFKIGLDTSEPLLEGVQSLPGDPPITVHLRLGEKAIVLPEDEGVAP